MIVLSETSEYADVNKPWAEQKRIVTKYCDIKEMSFISDDLKVFIYIFLFCTIKVFQNKD